MKKVLILLACTLVAGVLGAVAAEPPSEPATPTAPATAAEPAPIDFESGLFTPAPEPADPCHRCMGLLRSTSPGGGAASHWGFGSSCSIALQDVTNQLWSAAADICVDDGALGACSLTVVQTAPCWWNGSQWVIDAYATFKCMQYLC